MQCSKPAFSVAVILAAGLLAAAAPTAIRAAESEVGTVSIDSSGLSVAPRVGYERLLVTVSGPNDFVLDQEFDRSSSIFVPLADAAGNAPADGSYTYELRTVPHVEAAQREALRAARESGDQALLERLAVRLPRGAVQSGVFTIQGGSVVPGDLREPQARARSAAAPRPSGEAPVPPEPDATVLTNADGVIRNSACVGFDCPNSPTFSDTTVLLMENNTRIKYDDTSTLAGFPNRDWALNANDSASGGSSRFWIQDCGNSSQGGCSGNAVFSVEAGARNNALWVDSNNNVGLGTSTPVTSVHAVKGDTPALRLAQDGSSGFAPQTWDVAGNETSFFIRDATNGSTLPFRIRPGAPSSSLDIAASGAVGVGTGSPAAALHVRRTDGSAKLLVEEASATAADRVLMTLQNSASNNKSRFLMQSGSGANGIWTFDNNGQALDSFSITRVGAGVNAFTLASNGNLTIAGMLTQLSDRHAKEEIVAVDPQAMLSKVAALPISTWRYKADTSKHIGPMAQDFAAAFGFGADDTHVAPADVGGVALAAIKALNEVVSAKDAQLEAQRAKLDELELRNAELGARLAAIERALSAARR